jgi:hypothetical protein
MDGFAARYGGLVRMFQPRYFFFSLLLMLRSFFFALIASLLSANPLAQAVLAMMVLFIRYVRHASNMRHTADDCATLDVCVLRSAPDPLCVCV